MCSQGKETSGGFGRDSGVTPLMLAPREEAEDRRTLGRFNGVRAGSTYALKQDFSKWQGLHIGASRLWWNFVSLTKTRIFEGKDVLCFSSLIKSQKDRKRQLFFFPLLLVLQQPLKSTCTRGSFLGCH